VLAVVGQSRITRRAVDSLLATAPPSVQAQYRSSPEQYKEVVQRLVSNEVLHQAALRDSVQNDPGYKADLAGRAYELLIQYYFRGLAKHTPVPSDSAVEAAYNEHAKEFDVPGHARVRHILFRTQAQAKAARARLVAGASWAAVCQKESRDSLTSKNEGIIGYVTTDSDLVPGMGKAPAIVAAALALKPGEISRPIRTPRGWHLLLADERTQPSRTPLSDVRERIASQLRGDLQDAYAQSLVDSLRKVSGATIFDDSIAIALRPSRTPQDLFDRAQAAASPAERIGLYRQLVAQFPNERVSEQAAFMIGFTYAEELADSASARTAFEEFIRSHPKSDLVSSAKWMLENMNKPNPPFEGEAPPDSTEPQEGN
jgi:parvulin-like peptidyl-prolyl isomerase